MQNVEFKAELKDLPLARSICAAIGAMPVATIQQTDSYYRYGQSRLKKREVPGEPTEWIVYERADLRQPKLSRFTIYTDAEAQERFRPRSLQPWIVVKKVRELLMYQNVRIHLDTVEGLGTFLEFEALVSPRHEVPACRETLAELRRVLAPAMGEAIAVGYSDLLAGDPETEAGA